MNLIRLTDPSHKNNSTLSFVFLFSQQPNKQIINIYIFPISQKCNPQTKKKITISQKIFCSENQTGPIYTMFDCMNIQSENGDREKTNRFKRMNGSKWNKIKRDYFTCSVCVMWWCREGWTTMNIQVVLRCGDQRQVRHRFTYLMCIFYFLFDDVSKFAMTRHLSN